MNESSLNLKRSGPSIQLVEVDLKIDQQVLQFSTVLFDERLRHLAEVVNWLFDRPD